mmetsp:Transcript_9340/g.13777  ORF Transcript_9340/g.13777 Transcript_9340/m.13777 type:complete len:551 (-) Transcript_9340:436-2088(-)
MEDDDNNNINNNDHSTGPPLDLKVIQIIENSPNFTIRPGKLAAELGMSVDDACAELCGLLSAVGGGEGGASFTFESSDDKDDKSSKDVIMVFTFPPDFKRRALRKRRTEDIKSVLFSILHLSFQILKVVVAFGLILSLFILSIAVILSIIAAIIALSRGGGGSREHRAGLQRRLRDVFYTLRQILWCYAMYGASNSDQDPFLQETAGNLWFCMSLCSPFSFSFWWRANMLSRRRARYNRGWGGIGYGRGNSGLEGVALIRRGDDSWRHERSSTTSHTSFLSEEKGLLSIAVEFLFGPTPFWPGPSDVEKWKLRAAAIVSLSTSASLQGKKGVSLDELLPYSDSPPDTAKSNDGSGSLGIVMHFNGVPAVVPSDSSQVEEGGEVRFIFPELMAESNDVKMSDDTAESVEIQPIDNSWTALLYTTSPTSFIGTGRTLPPQQPKPKPTKELPPYLQERRHALTKLESSQFIRCAILGLLNFIGILWLRQSMERGGLLEFYSNGLTLGVVSVLQFYSKLFFVLPIGRLIMISVLNWGIDRHNLRRLSLTGCTEC